MLRKKLWILGLLSLLVACGELKKEKDPIKNPLVVVSDGSFKPLIEAEKEVFSAFYKKTPLQLYFRPETQAIKLLLNDSAQVIVVTRELNAEETAQLTAKKLKPVFVKIAVDAVTLITHPTNPDSLLTLDELRDILAGKVGRWQQLASRGLRDSIRIVFDSNGSGNLSFLKQRLGLPDSLSRAVYALRSNEEVIEYVKSHPAALGVIGVNWISDSDDPTSQRFRRDVRVLGVADSTVATPENAWQPYQAYLQLKRYPLSRDVFMIKRGVASGPGLDFINFVASQRGQLIVLKSGLLPGTATVNIRQVELKNE